MSILRFDDVSKLHDDLPVLREAFFKLEGGERVGLIGPNGCGKTTVLHLILGREEPTGGAVEVDDGLRVGYFSQFSEIDDEASVRDVLEAVCTPWREAEQRIEVIGAGLGEAEGAEQRRLLAEQQTLVERLDQHDGWEWRRHIEVVLDKLGFDDVTSRLPAAQLSGGWRNRAALAKTLLEKPDLLLLDEPTNFLDVEGLTWLEGWLRSWRGAAIVVSHDRHFLDAVVTRIVEIENHHFQEYPGGYSDYVKLRPLRQKQLSRQFRHEQELLIFEAEAIEGRRAGRAEMGRRLRRKIADIGKQETPRPVDRIFTGIYDRLHVSERLLRVEGLGKAYGERRLFDDLSFELERGDRLAVVGPNGCGKSTLMRVLALQEAPDRGEAAWIKGDDFVLFDEVLAGMDRATTPSRLVNVQDLSNKAPRKQVHALLELLRFSERDMRTRIGRLSGGLQARTALALCLLSGRATLLLDEPTNHLDVTTCQVMERALLHYPGAVIVASHDRFFIDKVATRVLRFLGGGRVEAISPENLEW